jgi:hypothetical protein
MTNGYKKLLYQAPGSSHREMLVCSQDIFFKQQQKTFFFAAK